MSDVLTGKALGLPTIKGHMITVHEIALFLRTSDKWVIMHMNDGTFPSDWFPVGERNHLVNSNDFDRWLCSIKVQAGNAPVPKESKKAKKEEKAKTLTRASAP